MHASRTLSSNREQANLQNPVDSFLTDAHFFPFLAHMGLAIDKAIATLTQGIAKVFSEQELKAKLELGRPLRVKLGVDPTAPDIHLGHTVPLEKLRQFQELGHQAILLIGDFTATVGDPTGRSAARPPLTREEVLANAETYTAQAFKILDKEKTEVVYNGDWFRKMTYEEVLKLNVRVEPLHHSNSGESNSVAEPPTKPHLFREESSR